MEPHDEASDGRGHEELYVVMTGAARFTLDGEEIDARPGTLVLVRPGTRREAVATEPDTLVLAVGAPPTFEPAGSEWLELARPHFESDPERAAALLDRGIGRSRQRGDSVRPRAARRANDRTEEALAIARASTRSAAPPRPSASRSSPLWSSRAAYQNEPDSRTPSASSCSIVLL